MKGKISTSDLAEAFARPLPELLEQAWAVRRQKHKDCLAFAAPGAKFYEIAGFRNDPHAFATVSVTGTACALRCEHCRGKLLASMHAVNTAAELMELGERLAAGCCQGVLVSGGADNTGQVPLPGFEAGLKHLKKLGLTVTVHTGLVAEQTARVLKDCRVDQVLTDVIGSSQTAARVYHLQRQPQDYGRTLQVLSRAGLAIAPHIVIGLDYGQVVGELEALHQIIRAGAGVIVLVVLNPLPGTPMAHVSGPQPEEVAKLIALARIFSPEATIALGCARPPGKTKKRIEEYALRAGVNTIAYPAEETVSLARQLQLETAFRSVCCSLL